MQESSTIFTSLLQALEREGIRSNYYLDSHPKRYQRTIEELFACVRDHVPDAENCAALEVGTSWVLNVMLKELLGFSRVDVIQFSDAQDPATNIRTLNSPAHTYSVHSLNLEKHKLPLEDCCCNLLIACEVVEHFDVDPMRVMSEFNRVLKDDGILFMTTPNSASANCLERILLGYSPGFYMKYTKDASPYKHNFEYSTLEIKDLVFSSGFEVLKCWTEDLFNQKVPTLALEVIEQHGLPRKDRGDDIIIIGKKVSTIKNRYPTSVYL